MADFSSYHVVDFSSNELPSSLEEDGQMRQADKQAVRQLGHNRQKINLKKTIGQNIDTHFTACDQQENSE
jgi:hypothetical protein